MVYIGDNSSFFSIGLSIVSHNLRYRWGSMATCSLPGRHAVFAITTVKDRSQMPQRHTCQVFNGLHKTGPVSVCSGSRLLYSEMAFTFTAPCHSESPSQLGDDVLSEPTKR
jgi:hypothetical protein